MRRRWILLVVSILIASLGTALVAIYVRQAEARATAGQVRTPVLVAVRAIPVGAAADSLGNAVTVRQVPTELVAADAVTSPGRLKGKAVERIWPGEQIVFGMFSTASSSPSGLAVPAGRLAVAVAVDDPGRVAGYVVPGSSVAVFVTGETSPTRLILPSADVVAVGLNPAGSTTRTPPGPIVTLALTEDQATELADAQRDGRLWLALRS